MTQVSIETEDERVYRTTHDMEEGGLSVTIAQALAEVDDVDAAEVIHDFSEYADPDAFDRLFRIRPSESHRHEAGFVSLKIQGADVTVRADGKIRIAL